MNVPIIDLTDRYFTTKFMLGGPPQWLIDRETTPVTELIVHHTAGWYGSEPGGPTTAIFEKDQLDALARDHYQRFGIGPGYHYVIFPQGQTYAVGKAGTHRAHTKGVHAVPPTPSAFQPWNNTAIGVVVFGDYENTRPPGYVLTSILTSLRFVVRDVQRYSKADERLRLGLHGSLPAQTSACPGQYLSDSLGDDALWSWGAQDEEGLVSLPPSSGQREEEEAAYQRGYVVGYTRGLERADIVTRTALQKLIDEDRSNR